MIFWLSRAKAAVYIDRRYQLFLQAYRYSDCKVMITVLLREFRLINGGCIQDLTEGYASMGGGVYNRNFIDD